MTNTQFVKDPDAVLDYTWDWRAETNETGDTDWLQSDESISTYEVLPDDGLTLDSDSESNGAVTAWFSGGTDDADYEVTCRIETDQGRTDDRTITIRVRER